MKSLNYIIQSIYYQYKKIPVPARAGVWFVACTMLQKGISFITVPIFTRIMPPEEYGLYSTYLSWYSILTVFCTLNMYSVVYVNDYTKASTREGKDKTAVPLLSLSMLLTIGVFILYLVSHTWLDKLIGMPFVLVCLLFVQILFEPPVNFWGIQQRFEYKYVILVMRTIAMVVLNAGLGIMFVWIASSNEAIARACSVVLVQVIFGGIFYVYFWKRAGKVLSTKGWKHALNVQVPLLPHNLSLTILSSSDRIMIRNMVDAAHAGIYSVAYSAGYVVNVFKNSIVDALRPWIYQKIRDGNYAAIRKNINSIMLLITLISAVFTAFAPEIMFIMAPAQYHGAIYVIPPVAASSYFTFLYNIFSIVGLYYEKTSKIMWASVSGAILNLALNLICIPVFGYIAAAYTTLICYMFFSLAHYMIMKSICKAKLNNIEIYDMKFILLMSTIIVVLTLIFALTYENSLIRYSIIAVLTIIIFTQRNLFFGTIKELKKNNNRI